MPDLAMLAKGTFRIQCRRIVLHRKGVRPLRAAGPGEIKQSDDGRLTVAVQEGPKMVREIFRDGLSSHSLGSLVGADERFNLTAVEADGTKWKGRAVLPQISGSLDRGGIIWATVEFLEKIKKIPISETKDYAEVYILGQLNFPKNSATETIIRRRGKPDHSGWELDHARVALGSEEYSIFLGDNVTRIEMSLQKNAVKKFRHVRLLEALQYALGQITRHFAVVTRGNGKARTLIRNPLLNLPKAEVFPPYLFSGNPKSVETYQIAEAYYRKISPLRTEAWHPISWRVYQVIASDNTPIDVQALVYSIATEAIAELCASNLGSPSTDFLKDLDAVEKNLATMDLKPASVKRISGSLVSMKKPRNSDRLKAFIETRGLPPALYSKWKSLRNTTAHGTDGDLTDAGYWADKHVVLYLFHAEILAFIGYTGPRTDYMTNGYPIVTPSAVSSAGNLKK
jgi:hypothetical protein